MAKTKNRITTSPKRRTAKDFMPNTIELSGGIKMQARLRMGGMQYLEAKYDCALVDVPFQNGRIGPLFDLLVAMLMGQYPDKTVEELEAIVKSIDLQDLQAMTTKLTSAIATQTKKLPKKNEPKAATTN